MPKRHEQLLFRYSSALERGDFEAVAEILREAERDPELEAMILELNAVYAAEPREQTNHRNPKELVMIAPLYQKRTPAPTRPPYTLPMIAALALVALIGVLLATRIAPPTQWNTGQDGSQEAIVMQVDPTDCAQGVPFSLKLYSRPAADALVINEYHSVLYLSQANLRQSDAVEVDGESWYFVTINTSFEDIRGWITAEDYNRNVRCAPLINPTINPTFIAQVTESAALTGTPTPFRGNFDATVTAIAAQVTALPPVPTSEDDCDVIITVADETALRQTPALDAEVVDYLPAGTVVQSIGQTMTQFEDETTTWVYVDIRLGERRAAGWVAVENTSSLNLDCLTPISQHPFYVVTEPPPDFILPNTGTPVSFSPTVVRADVQALVTITPTPAPFTREATALPPTPTLDPLAVAANFPPGYGCTIVTENVVNIQDEPSNTAPVREQLPAGTPLAILLLSSQAEGDWYLVNYRTRMGSLTFGVIASSLIDVPEDCNYFGAEGELIPAADVQTATPLPPTIVPEESMSVPDYPVYTVQEGDTLLSILAQFNLEANILPELLFINNLPDDTVELPETLLIPVRTGAQLLSCVVDAGETVDLRAQPDSDAEVIATLTEGATFRVLDRWQWEGETWYLIAAQLSSATINKVWVNSDAISFNADCQRFFPIYDGIASVPLELTATALPPTVVPGTVLILPPTVVSPDSIQTQDAVLSASQPSCTGVSMDVLSIYAGPVREGRVIFEVPAGSVLDVSAYSDERDGRWHMVGYWAAAGVYIAGMAAPDTLTLSENCNDLALIVTYTPTPLPSLPPRQTATPTPAA